MRIRTIKPEFWESEAVAACSLGARLTFIGLWNMADDGGTGKANSRIVKSNVWPLDDKISSDEVGTFMVELAREGLIHVYTTDDRLYYHVTKWDQHQSASYRRGESQHPAPPVVQESADLVIPDPPRVQENAALVSTPEVESAGTGNREGNREGIGTGIKLASSTRERDPIWDLFVECYGQPTASARKAWNSAAKTLRDYPADPDEIRAMIVALQGTDSNWAVITPTALAKHFGQRQVLEGQLQRKSHGARSTQLADELRAEGL